MLGQYENIVKTRTVNRKPRRDALPEEQILDDVSIETTNSKAAKEYFLLFVR